MAEPFYYGKDFWQFFLTLLHRDGNDVGIVCVMIRKKRLMDVLGTTQEHGRYGKPFLERRTGYNS
jgi:hypothetical protein